MKTLFILGAGASRDFGFPLGDELKAWILEQLALNPRTPMSSTFALLTQAGNGTEDILEFARRLDRSLLDTIDDFLAAQQTIDTFRRIGKQAVALNIAVRERDDALFKAPRAHWYKTLLRFLRQNPGRISSAHFSFLTFNYDRSLEHCLHEALLSTNDDLRGIVEEDFLGPRNVCHVHGSVGLLPWQRHSADSVVRSYGDNVSPKDLIQMGRNILSPHESFRLHAAHEEMLVSADVIAIIGFGFHEQNMKRIHFDELSKTADKMIFATVMGLQNKDSIEEYSKTPSVRTFPVDAKAFVREFLRNMQSGTLGGWGGSESILEPTRLANLKKLMDEVTRPPRS